MPQDDAMIRVRKDTAEKLRKLMPSGMSFDEFFDTIVNDDEISKSIVRLFVKQYFERNLLFNEMELNSLMEKRKRTKAESEEYKKSHA